MSTVMGPAVMGPAAPAVQSASPAISASVSDADNQTPTSWLWYVNVDTNFLTTQVNNGYRIADLSVASGSPLLFNAALVKNTGSYAQAWWWYVGQTTTQVTTLLNNNHARLTVVDPYLDGSNQEKYAVVMVDNTGANAKGWWYVNDSISDISSKLQANNARLVDVNQISVNGSTSYSVIMDSNTGADQKAWWWYVDDTISDISSKLQANNARVVDIQPVDSSHFNVIMDQSAGEEWWWYVGQTTSQLSKYASQNGARIFDVQSYLVNGQTLYAALMINNSNPIETTVGNILRGASPTAATGLYLKQVAGPVLAQLQPDKQFEPASMIKALLNLTAMRAVQAGTASLNEQLYMYYKPGTPYIDFNNPGNPNENPDSYADTSSNRVLLPMSVLLSRMMEISDNRATKSIEQRFGIPAINATAQLAGMTNTVFGSTLGSGIPGNYLTLTDAGKLYEGVLNHSLLDAPDAAQFFDNMSDQPDPGEAEPIPVQDSIFGPFQTDVTEEAAAILGRPQSDPLVVDLAGAFVAQMKGAWKGGSYTIPAANSQWDEVRTAGGYVGLPYMDSGGNITLQNYVYGIFIDGALVPQNPYPNTQVDAVNNAWSDSQQELLRGQIHDALASWHVNPNIVVTNLNDSGPGSLRSAINLADHSAGAATITFTPNVSGIVHLTSGELALDNPFCRILIKGPGAGVLSVNANRLSRVFDVAHGTSVEIDDLSITNGNSVNSTGGGIYDNGNLTVYRSIINSNGAQAGAGIEVDSGGGLSLFDSSIDSNFGNSGGGIDNSGSVYAVNSTIANNTGSTQGGGLRNSGAAAIATLANVTVSANRSGLGGGIYRGAGTVTLNNTLIAGNFHGTSTTPDDMNGTVSAVSANNLVGTGGSGGLTNGTNGNQVGVANPGLSALGNWGGPTPTFALMFNSPAYNHGSNSLIPGGVTTDQRGLPRIFGGTVDVGAYESQPPALQGDVNHDGAVNFADLLVLAQNYGKTNVPMYELGDLDGDGSVRFADLLSLAQNYGHTSPAASAVAQAAKRRY